MERNVERLIPPVIWRTKVVNMERTIQYETHLHTLITLSDVEIFSNLRWDTDQSSLCATLYISGVV